MVNLHTYPILEMNNTFCWTRRRRLQYQTVYNLDSRLLGIIVTYSAIFDI